MAEAYPNTLIFVDLPTDDPDKAGEFYAEVFGWKHEPRLPGLFHRMVPGQKFLNPDNSQSEVGNLHIGIFDINNTRPHPEDEGVEPRYLAPDGRKARMWVLVSSDDSVDRIMSTAERLGATILWRNHYWEHFNGFCDAFLDPWGNTIVTWIKGGDNPKIPEGYTHE
jgi:catechol 2,3-dioxygenase-like lactoylglutathione lyase family enzyme